MEKDLEARIRRMFRHLDDEAIARALNVEVDLVRGVLDGEAQVISEERRSGGVNITTFAKPAFRQRVIGIARAKGGVGATFLTLNMAWRVSEKISVLVVDTTATITGYRVCSDFLDTLEVEPFDQPQWEEPEVCELTDNLHYLSYPRSYGEYDLEKLVLEARQSYDAIVVDLPVANGAEMFNFANAVIYLYGGGMAEAWRLMPLLGNQSLAGKKQVYVTSALKHPLLNEEIAGDWIYLPYADKKKKGIVDVKTPAGSTITQIITEVWDIRFTENENTSFLGRLLRKGG